MDRLRELQDFFGGGPIAAVAACAVLAVVVLFVLLIREKNAHLKTAVQIVVVNAKLEKTAEVLADVLADAVDALEEISQRTGRRRRRRAPALASGNPDTDAVKTTPIQKEGQGDAG